MQAKDARRARRLYSSRNQPRRDATDSGRRDAFTTRRRILTRVRRSSTQRGERSRAKRRSPPPRAAGNLRRRKRASMQRPICRRSTNVHSRLHAERTRAPLASFRESTQRMGFIVRERSIGLTPRGKLRAHPCSGPAAPLYEPCPSPAELPCPPDSFTGYVRPHATHQRRAPDTCGRFPSLGHRDALRRGTLG